MFGLIIFLYFFSLSSSLSSFKLFLFLSHLIAQVESCSVYLPDVLQACNILAPVIDFETVLEYSTSVTYIISSSLPCLSVCTPCEYVEHHQTVLFLQIDKLENIPQNCDLRREIRKCSKCFQTLFLWCNSTFFETPNSARSER